MKATQDLQTSTSARRATCGAGLRLRRRNTFVQAAPAARQTRGSVLIAVLAMILLISFIVTRFVDEAVQDLEYRSLFNEPADVRSFAYSMLEVSLATVQEVALIDGGKLHAPEQGWSDPIAYAGIEIPNGWTVSVNIQDESGKLSINTMDEDTLNRMLEESFDFDFGTARELSSMFKDWTDSDDNRRLNGAESEDYLDRNPPYRAANGPIQSLEELRLIEIWEDEFFNEDGSPNELFEKLEGMVSVTSSGPANLNSSPDTVLEVLALQDGYNEEFLFDGLSDLPYLTELPGSANSENSGVEVTLLRVTISLMRGELPFTISALVEPNFSEEGASGGGGGNLPGSSSDDAPKTGSSDEQDAIQYPFRIVQLSEYSQGDYMEPPGRHSALDIGEESDSF